MRNTGFCGITLCTVKLVGRADNIIQSWDYEITKHQQRMAVAVCDLVRYLDGLRKLLTTDTDSVRIRSEKKNNTMYNTDFAAIVGGLDECIHELYNYAPLMGDDMLILVEASFMYRKMLTKEEPGELPVRVVERLVEETAV